MGGEEREREEGEGKEGGKEGEREAKKGSGGAKEGGGCEERRREGKGEGEGKPIPTDLNAYPKSGVTVEWSHNMWGRSPFFFGPLQTTASSLFCSRKPIDITASI